jgi:dTDP-4-dehydrorhamnose 3,5-epimerase
MTIEKTFLEGVFTIKNFFSQDNRGVFVKTFHKDIFDKNGLETQFTESYYSFSHKNVIRGMHFQQPPHDHSKLVYVTDGEILDVILDLRKDSITFGKYMTILLAQFSNSVYIPKGCAHGFLTLSDKATVIYNVSTIYNMAADTGIKWNSFGFNWNINTPILSVRDNSFIELKNFNSPF